MTAPEPSTGDRDDRDWALLCAHMSLLTPAELAAADAHIEVCAVTYDGFISGMGDALRQAWLILRAHAAPRSCPCPPHRHDGTCPATPLWRNTIEHLGIDPHQDPHTGWSWPWDRR